MATLERFKILATQCGVAQSPTRSPRTSPLVHLPRKKTTLRMLLTRNTSRRAPPPLPVPVLKEPRVKQEIDGDSNENKKNTSHKLKDLFVSSTTSFEDEERETEDNVVDDRVRYRTGTEVMLTSKLTGLGGVPGSGRPGWIGFRHRLLRKAWRPMLAAIPE